MWDSCDSKSAISKVKVVITLGQNWDITLDGLESCAWYLYLHEAIEFSLPLRKGKIVVCPIDVAAVDVEDDVVEVALLDGGVIRGNVGPTQVVPVAVMDAVVDNWKAVQDCRVDGVLDVDRGLLAGRAKDLAG